MLTCISLFSGIGMDAYAAQQAGFQLIGLCEIQPFLRGILKKNFPEVPIWEDVHDVHGDKEAERPDLAVGSPTLLIGSAPFQANYSRGEIRRGDPHWLWNEFARVVRELRPTWVVSEHVPRQLHLDLDSASWDLEREGYATAPLVLPASAFDCPQRIERLFLVGALREGPRLARRSSADGGDARIEPWPAPEPSLCRVDQGHPLGMDFQRAALHAIGDSSVPRMAEAIFRGIAETEREFLNQGGENAASSDGRDVDRQTGRCE